jgi:hypothetical protein
VEADGDAMLQGRWDAWSQKCLSFGTSRPDSPGREIQARMARRMLSSRFSNDTHEDRRCNYAGVSEAYRGQEQHERETLYIFLALAGGCSSVQRSQKAYIANVRQTTRFDPKTKTGTFPLLPSHAFCMPM